MPSDWGQRARYTGPAVAPSTDSAGTVTLVGAHRAVGGAPPAVVLPEEVLRHYAVCMMRAEERYWVKVSLTIGFVVLALLILLISGVVGNMEDIVTNILKDVQ